MSKNKSKVPIATIETNYGTGVQDNNVKYTKSINNLLNTIPNFLNENSNMSKLQNNLTNPNLSGTMKLASKAKIGFEAEDKEEAIKQKLIVLKDLLRECQDNTVKTWLRDKINEYLIEIL